MKYSADSFNHMFGLDLSGPVFASRGKDFGYLFLWDKNTVEYQLLSSCKMTHLHVLRDCDSTKNFARTQCNPVLFSHHLMPVTSQCDYQLKLYLPNELTRVNGGILTLASMFYVVCVSV